MDIQYMEILEHLKTRHLLTSSAVDFLARTSALPEKRYICINDLKNKDYGKVFKSS